MALVQRTHLAVFRFRDNDGAESTCEVNLPQSVGLAAAYNFAAALAPLVQALSDAALIWFDVMAQWVEVNRLVIPATADVARVGVFVFETINSPTDRYVASIPSIKAETLKPDGDYAGVAIDPEHALVAPFVAAMLDGIDGVRPRAPWQFYTNMGGGGGGWGGIGGGGGGWGGSQGGGGPWGAGNGGGGSWGVDALDDFWQGDAPSLRKLTTAYKGYSNERANLPIRRL